MVNIGAALIIILTLFSHVFQASKQDLTVSGFLRKLLYVKEYI